MLLNRRPGTLVVGRLMIVEEEFFDRLVEQSGETEAGWEAWVQGVITTLSRMAWSWSRSSPGESGNQVVSMRRGVPSTSSTQNSTT